MGITKIIVVAFVSIIVLGLLGFSLLMKVAMHEVIEAGFSVAIVVGGHIHMKMHKQTQTAKRRHKSPEAFYDPAHNDATNAYATAQSETKTKTKMPRFNKVEWSDEDLLDEVEHSFHIGNVTIVRRRRNIDERR